MNRFWAGVLFSGIPPLFIGSAVAAVTDLKSGLVFGIVMFACFAYVIFSPSSSDKYDY